MTTWEQQVDFVRAMPTAAAKILWILFISGRSLTGRELQYACGMAEGTINNGLAWLEPRSLIQNNGKFNGWTLTAVARQLPLPFDALPAGENPENGENLKIWGFHSSSSSSYKKEEKEEIENLKIWGFLTQEQKDVQQLLVGAGIGERSRKMKQLLELGLSVEFVTAHIHVWLWRDSEPAGYLITRLESGEMPPPCYCPDCRPPAVPAEYANLIMR